MSFAVLPFALMGLGTAMSVAGQISQVKALKQANQLNAMQAEREAALACEKAAQEAEDLRWEKVRMAGRQHSIAAANGIDISGSSLDLLASTALEYDWDIERILRGGEWQSESSLLEAQNYRSKAKSAMTTEMLGAGSTLLTGAGSLYGKYKSGF